MDTDVPVPIRDNIVQLKQTLVELTDVTLAALPSTATTSQIEQRLKAVLPSKQEQPVVQTPGKDDDMKPQAGNYGAELSATVTQPAPGTLLVQQSFSIMCGQDTVLLGYNNSGGTWKRILRWQAPAYDKVSGAFGDLFETPSLRPQRDGKPVLLVVDGTPWCTSTMSGFAMDTFVLDPGHPTDKPFWHGEHGYRRADDVPPYAFSLKTTGDGFEIRASVNDWTDAIARVGIMRYRLTPTSVERTLPIAMNSRETVEEWLSMSRQEAAHFTDAAPGSLTWKMFDTFTYEGKPENAETPSMLYGPVRPCTDDPRHFQVEIDSKVYSNGNSTSAPGAPYFVQVQQTGNGYLLHDTTATPAPACSGRPVQFGAGYGSSG